MSDHIPEEPLSTAKPKEVKEREPAKSKLTVMGDLQAELAKSTFATVLIWNSWTNVRAPSVVLKDIEAPPKTYQPPDMVHPSHTPFSGLTLNQQRQYRVLAGIKDDGEVSEDTFQKLAARTKTEYIKWGRNEYKKFKDGNCTVISCAVVGFLADHLDLVPPGARVEVFTMNIGFQGHAYVVVGRAGDTPSVLSSWDDDCFVIDVWYARQQAEPPGTYAVKDLTGTGTYRDPGFTLLSKAKSVSLTQTFTRAELSAAT